MILEQYENETGQLNGLAKPSYAENITNQDSDLNEVNGVQTNGTPTAHAKITSQDSDLCGVDSIQTNGTLTTHANRLRRRLFVFSANDKSSLRTQMDGIGACLKTYGEHCFCMLILEVSNISRRTQRIYR